MNLPAGFLVRFRPRAQKPLAIRFVVKNLLPAIAPIQHLINRTGILAA